jgi:P27 family predicted phage terminase small subunit
MAAREFDRVVEILRQQGTLDRVDSVLVARRAELHELATVAYRSVLKEGALIQTQYGPKANPSIRVHATASAELRLIDKALGLTAPLTRVVSKVAPSSDLRARWAEHLRGPVPSGGGA